MMKFVLNTLAVTMLATSGGALKVEKIEKQLSSSQNKDAPPPWSPPGADPKPATHAMAALGKQAAKARRRRQGIRDRGNTMVNGIRPILKNTNGTKS